MITRSQLFPKWEKNHSEFAIFITKTKLSKGARIFCIFSVALTKRCERYHFLWCGRAFQFEWSPSARRDFVFRMRRQRPRSPNAAAFNIVKTQRVAFCPQMPFLRTMLPECKRSKGPLSQPTKSRRRSIMLGHYLYVESRVFKGRDTALKSSILKLTNAETCIHHTLNGFFILTSCFLHPLSCTVHYSSRHLRCFCSLSCGEHLLDNIWKKKLRKKATQV